MPTDHLQSFPQFAIDWYGFVERAAGVFARYTSVTEAQTPPIVVTADPTTRLLLASINMRIDDLLLSKYVLNFRLAAMHISFLLKVSRPMSDASYLIQISCREILICRTR